MIEYHIISLSTCLKSSLPFSIYWLSQVVKLKLWPETLPGLGNTAKTCSDLPCHFDNFTSPDMQHQLCCACMLFCITLCHQLGKKRINDEHCAESCQSLSEVKRPPKSLLPRMHMQWQYQCYVVVPSIPWFCFITMNTAYPITMNTASHAENSFPPRC